MPPQIARLLVQHIEPLVRDFPPAAPLLECGGFGCFRRIGEFEGLFVGHQFTHPTRRSSEPATASLRAQRKRRWPQETNPWCNAMDCRVATNKIGRAHV